MKRLKLKVCGMRESENIAAVAALAPDYLGLVFVEGSPRDATGVVAREALAGIPAGVTTVGVFRDAPLDVVRETVETLPMARWWDLDCFPITLPTIPDDAS